MRGAALCLLAALRPATARSEGDGLPVMLSESPRVYIIDDFASEEETAHIRAAAEPQLQGLCMQRTLGGECVANTEKMVSDSAYLDAEAVGADAVMAEVVRRIHEQVMVPAEYGESLQVTRYNGTAAAQGAAEGAGFYALHADSSYRLGRTVTAILYLTTSEEGEGGETIFPTVRAPGAPERLPAVSGSKQGEHGIADYCRHPEDWLHVRPRRGRLLLHYGHRPDLSEDPLAVHGSCPVLGAAPKWIAQRFIRWWSDARRGNELYRRVFAPLGLG
eukprot:TRINITY_DN29779_c0_g1_i1.p1 TRINITY_DN29779_c0_g1~~TRINITY_DN29779_c0_g1_i1.p1  ORF type:complete len:301 (+),score=97.34 TRINITY_DN29779_c0_g1_i1:80-904(+)